MEYIVRGNIPLNGEISVCGAKNCALALLGATILTDETVVLTKCPHIADVDNMLLLLKKMGKKVSRNGQTVQISGKLNTVNVPAEVATLLRGSVLVLGAVLARYGQLTLPLPGGCAIGARPIDIHTDGLKHFGVSVEYDDKGLVCKGKPQPSAFKLRFASVGATENLLCAAVLSQGQSVLYNCATEPEVVALEQMLVQMGAQINGVGGSVLTITGVQRLSGTVFDIIPDRIVAATYLSAAVASHGKVTVSNCCPQHLSAFINAVCGRYDVRLYNDAVTLNADRAVSDYGKVVTAPYPGFPTDMQSLLLSLAALSAGGTTKITENLFENRLQHNADQLALMGADISVNGNTASVRGQCLFGAELCARDLRGGAGLVVAALGAEGTSAVRGVEHINRGYVDLAAELSSLGADIHSVGLDK